MKKTNARHPPRIPPDRTRRPSQSRLNQQLASRDQAEAERMRMHRELSSADPFRKILS